MASERLLRIPMSGGTGEYVLVNVSSSGRSQLDLNLVATEGSSPFALSGT
jgi:hypothetical protein